VHQRRLAEPPRREDDDVLPVESVGGELADLGVAIGEGVIERNGSVFEGVVGQSIYLSRYSAIYRILLSLLG
jgi:hypothetical protein